MRRGLGAYSPPGRPKKIKIPWYSLEYNNGINGLSLSPWLNTDVSSFAVQRQIGGKQYELNNHLGNVQATVSDLPYWGIGGSDYGIITRKSPAMVSAYDYYPFGMLMPDRYVSDTSSHCVTITKTQWVPHDTTICHDVYDWQWPNFRFYGLATAAVSGGVLNFTAATVTDAVSVDLNVVPNLNHTLELTLLSADRLTSDSRLIVEQQIADGSWQQLVSTSFTKGLTRLAFLPTTPIVRWRLVGPFYVNVGTVCVTEKVLQQQIMLVDVCNEDKDRYRFGFNGKEKVNEWSGIGNHLDYGARGLDTRTARWIAVDAMANVYPSSSPYNYALNTPLAATDPDGNLVIFINGLRLAIGQGDQAGYGYNEPGADDHRGIYNYDIFQYWETNRNNFGRKAEIAKGFINKIGDHNVWFTSGSSKFTSQPWYRMEQGVAKAKLFHQMVQNGQIKLQKGETIKIVSHSQGGAFSVGFGTELLSYKDKDGKPLYNIEVMYFIAPHQPQRFSTIPGIRSIQYSHPRDATASRSPWWLPNGGTEFGKIQGVRPWDFVGIDIFGGVGQPKGTGPGGNNSGHSVTDNDFILDIPQGKPGAVESRKDVGISGSSTSGTTNTGSGKSIGW